MRKELVVRFVYTIDQLADIFTKGLSSARFSLIRGKLMVRPRPISLRGHISITDDKGPMSLDKLAMDSKDPRLRLYSNV